MWYTTTTVQQAQTPPKQFQAKRPSVKAEFCRAGGMALVNKILGEAQAGQHRFDVALVRGDAVSVLKAKGLVSNYLSVNRSD